MSYTNVFGGNTIYPSDVSYLAVDLVADIELEWPLESSGELPPAARIIDVTPNVNGWSIVLPDATLTGAGQVILFNNVSGSRTFYVKDNAGNTLATIAQGEQWELYLAATTTAAGTWRVFRFGASTATVQPSALAGFGLTVTNSTLSQSLPVTTFQTTGITVATSNRASALVWNGLGSGTLNLLTAASAGNNFFVYVRNEGGGDLTIDPAGSETINSAPTLALRPGDSATLITDGAQWYTIGLGQQAVFAFDYTSITVTGGNYTLVGSELNRIAYKFVGNLTSDVHVIVPSTIQQYWINNATTGAFNFFVQTSGGTPTQVNQGAKGIYYCDGSNMVLGSDPTSLTTPIVVSDGGTGATTASAARLNLGITLFADAIVTANTGASVRTTIGSAASGANSDITSLSGLTTPLSIAQGGTNSTTASGARSALGAASAGANSDITSLSGLTTPLSVGQGGTGATTASGARSALGAAASGANSDITSLSGLTTPLSIGQGGTGATTASGARSALSAAASGANSDITSLSGLTTPLSVGQGGTGATTASGARSALGAAASGANSDITSLSGLTTPLSIAQGGTGATTASGARSALGAAASGANSDITSLSAVTAINQSASVNASGTVAADTIGYRGIPQNSQAGAYTLALADAGKQVSNTTGGFVIPANGSVAFPVGTAIVLYNDSSSPQNISITSDTLRQAGTTNTGTRALGAYGVATVMKVASTTWVISGTGVS